MKISAPFHETDHKFIGKVPTYIPVGRLTRILWKQLSIDPLTLSLALTCYE